MSSLFAVDIEELRYPFSSFAEFISGALGVQSIHLLVGLIGVILIYITTLNQRSNLSYKLALLVIATSPFNNPAYNFLSGLSFSEITGILLLILLFFNLFNISPHRNSLSNLYLVPTAIRFKLDLFLLLLGASIISLILCSFTGLPYPVVIDNQPLVFIQSNFRLLLASLSSLIITCRIRLSSKGNEVHDAYYCFSKVVILIFICQVICYLVLISGSTPYGTFLGAGFSSFPAFGAVSNERGHLGRLICFMPGLISMLVYHIKTDSSFSATLRSFIFSPSLILPLSIFSVVLTMSSSSIALISSWLVTLILLSVSRTIFLIRVRKSLFTKLIPILTITCVVAIILWDGLSASFAKIVDLSINGQYDGVRAISFDALPFLWGTGYYGSTGREFLPISATDSGFSVLSQYFGISYYVFLVIVGAFAISSAVNSYFRTGSTITLLSTALCVQVFIFCFSEVSIGQYSMVLAWFFV